MDNLTANAPIDFPSAAGETGERIHSQEDHLRNLFSNAPAAICVLRGSRHVHELANEMYLQLLGKTAVLGKTVREVFPELEGQGFYELLDNVYATGKPFISNEMLTQVYKGKGNLAQLYLNFVYQPTRNNEGEIDGVFCHGLDVTEQVLARKQIEENERKQAFLLKLSDAVRPLHNPADIEEAVTNIALEFMNADRCYYNSLEEGNAVVRRDAFRGDFTSLAGVYPISSFPLFKAVVDAGRPFIVDDVYTSDIMEEGLRQICVQVQVISMINVPVIKSGKTVGVLSLVQSEPRKWTDAEVQLIIETAERIWVAIERAKAQEALRQSDEKYRSLFNSIHDAFCIIEMIFDDKGAPIDWIYVETNPAFSQHATMEMKGKRISEIVPEMEAFWLEKYGGVARTGEPVQLEHIVKGLGDQWFQTSAFLHGPKGSNRVAVLFRNITERKQAEEKLKESEKQFKNVLLQSPNIFAILEGFPKMMITFANEPLFKSWGRTSAIIGKPLLEVLPEIKDQPFPKLLQQVFETGETYYNNEEKAVIIKDGVPVATWFNFVYQPIFNDIRLVTGVTIMATDITEQVLSRKKIEESKEQQTFLLKFSDKLRAEQTVDAVANRALQMLSEHLTLDRCYIGVYQLAEDRGVFPYQIGNERVPPMPASVRLSDFPDALRVAFDRTLVIDDVTKTKGLANTDRQNLGALGLCALVAATLRRGEVNPLWSIVAVSASPRRWTLSDVKLIEEVTERTWAAVERAKVEEALRKSEEKYRTLFNSIDQGFVLCELVRNKEGKGFDYYMLEINPTYEKQTGISKEMVIGKTILEVFPTIDKEHIETFAAVVDNQCPVVFEQYFEVNHRWHEVKVYPAEKDKFTVLFCDITERKQTEEKIKESENRFRTMADALPVLIWTLDTNGLSSYYNKTFLDFLGVSKDAEISDWAPIVHPDDVEFTADTINTAIAEHRTYSFELRLLRADGQWRWVLAQGNPSIGANNEFLGFVGSSVDITERKQAEEKIKESEHRFHELIYSSPSMMAILKGEDMIIEIANDAVLASWGKGTDIIGKSLFLVLPETVEQGFDKLLLSVYKTGEPFYAYETPVILLRNGINELIYYNFVYQAQRNINGGIEGVAILANEVTPQALLNLKIKASEQELRKIKEQLELSIQAGKIGIWHWDVKNDVLTWSKEQKEIYGISDLEMITSSAQFNAFIVPEDLKRIQGDQSAGIRLEHEYDFRIIRKNDGKIRWVKSRARNIVDEQGALEFISGVNIDITEQVLALNKIQESEEKFKRLVLQAPVAICVLRGKDYVIETMNEGMCALWDRTLAQALNEPVFDVLPEVRNQGIKELLDNVYFTGERCVIQELSVDMMRNGKLENAFVKFVFEPLREGDGTVSGVMALAHEITEQVVARKKVEESEKKFEAAILAVEGIIWTNNAKGEMTGEQPGWANLTGQHFEEYQGYGWSNAIHPDDAQPTVDAWNQAVATNSTFEFEHRVKTAQNEWRLFSVKAVPAFDKNGAIQQWVGVHTDITEQKLAQEKLAYRTALLEAHTEASIDGLLLVDANGKILSFNQRFVEIWNIPQHILNDKDDEAVLSFAMSQLVNPQQVIDTIKYFYEHPTETCLDELELKNGKIVERNGYSVIGEDGTYYAWSWTFKDITERKRIDNDLKNAKDQLELTFKNIPAGVYLINAKGQMVYVNDRGAAVYGDFTPEYMLEHNDLSTQLKIADELFERFDENGNYFSAQNSPAYISLTTGKPSQAVLKQINKVTRQQRWYYVQGAPLFDEKGNVSLVLITSTDITEQKNAEEKIKYSEERFRSLAETLPQMVWVMNGDGEMEYASKSWEKYSGIDEVAEAWNYMMHPDDREWLTAFWNEAFAKGKGYQHEVRLKSKEGVYRWFYSVGEPVLDADKKVSKWVGSLTDIHEQKLKDEKKDEFIGIASHELKTPLTTVKGYLQMLERSLGDDMTEALLFTRKATQSVNRLSELVGELLDVSKIRLGKLNYNFTTFNFNVMVDSTIENIQITSLTHSIIKSGKISVEVTGDKDRLQQVLINLLTNAIKYSPGVQNVFITVEQENESIKVSVKDFGLGMGKESLKKIFDKYHRIEEHAVHFQGLGIGLFICYEIIQRHNGKLWAESELGKGSTFYFTLPIQNI